MNKKGKYVDYAFLIIIGLLTCLTIYRHYSADFILSINNYLGLLLFIVVSVLKLFKLPQNKYLVFILLVFYTFNIINFTVERFNISIGIDPGELQYNTPSINPVAVILLIVYLFLNGSVIKQLYTDTDAEGKEKSNKKVDFYHHKFNSCSDTELTDIFNNYDNYPDEARTALDKIRSNNK
ncbi:MAG: hypothetical protein V4456_07545 [Bacteroidota bacterium]